MKLGICYMVFDGEELLEAAIKSIRNVTDFISVTYQSTSYFGNPAGPELAPLVMSLKEKGLIDELIYFEPNLSRPPKENELALRNLGLEASRRAGCTHHISADVDEFYDATQLEHAKKIMVEGDYDFSLAYNAIYYKNPCYLVTPSQKLMVTFMHPVANGYVVSQEPVFRNIETTRRHVNHEKYRVFSEEELTIHHMSYVRKDIRKKFSNSDNGRFYKINKFMATFDTYKVGERVCLLPDYRNRKTVLVENKFGIQL